MPRWRESIIACVLIFIAGIYTYGILQIQVREFTSNEIGPMTFPYLLVLLLVVLAISLFIGQWFTQARRKTKIIGKGRAINRKIIAVVFLLFLYLVTLQSIGFLWTTPFFIGALSVLYQTRRPLLIVGTSVGTTFAIYGLLIHLFGFILP